MGGGGVWRLFGVFYGKSFVWGDVRWEWECGEVGWCGWDGVVGVWVVVLWRVGVYVCVLWEGDWDWSVWEVGVGYGVLILGCF